MAKKKTNKRKKNATAFGGRHWLLGGAKGGIRKKKQLEKDKSCVRAKVTGGLKPGSRLKRLKPW